MSLYVGRVVQLWRELASTIAMLRLLQLSCIVDHCLLGLGRVGSGRAGSGAGDVNPGDRQLGEEVGCWFHGWAGRAAASVPEGGDVESFPLTRSPAPLFMIWIPKDMH